MDYCKETFGHRRRLGGEGGEGRRSLLLTSWMSVLLDRFLCELLVRR